MSGGLYICANSYRVDVFTSTLRTFTCNGAAVDQKLVQKHWSLCFGFTASSSFPYKCVTASMSSCTNEKVRLRDSALTVTYEWATYEVKNHYLSGVSKLPSNVALQNELVMPSKLRWLRLSRPLKTVSRERILEIDILGTAAVLLLVLVSRIGKYR